MSFFNKTLFVLIFLTNAVAVSASDCSFGERVSYQFPFNDVNKELIATPAILSMCADFQNLEFLDDSIKNFLQINTDNLDKEAAMFQRFFIKADEYEAIGVVAIDEEKIAVIKLKAEDREWVFTFNLEEVGSELMISKFQAASQLKITIGYAFTLDKNASEAPLDSLSIRLSNGETPNNNVLLVGLNEIDSSSSEKWVLEEEKRRSPPNSIRPTIVFDLGDLVWMFYQNGAPLASSDSIRTLRTFSKKGDKLELINERWTDDIIGLLTSLNTFTQLKEL